MGSADTLGYAIAVVAYLALGLLVLASDRRLRQGRALIAAAVASAVWALFMFVFESGRSVPYWVLAAVEALRYTSWVIFLNAVAPARVPVALRWLVLSALIGWAALGGLLVPAGRVLTLGGLGAALLGLVMIEQVIRNASGEARRQMRYLMLGVGGIFAYDLFMFSHAELMRGIDADSWHLRGFVSAMLVPFLIAGARRLPHVRFEMFLSRQVTFYTSAFLAVGIYVLLIAAAGLLMRRLDDPWGNLLRISFLGGAIVVLLALVGSVAIRRRVRVFLSKHFYRSRYDYRVEWLRFIRTLSSVSADELSTTAVQSVAQILNAPGGVLFRQPEGTSVFQPVAVWPPTLQSVTGTQVFDPDSPLVSLIRNRRWIVDLRERERKPDLYDHADVPEWLAGDQRWRLISPIFIGDSLLGFFLLLEPPGQFRLMYEDRDLLNTAGQHVATLLALQDADQRVSELSQLEAYNRLTTFVMHDLKNCAAQLQLLVGNAERHRQNPQFIDDAFTTIARTSERMTRLIGQLRRKGGEEAVRPVELREVLQAALERCAVQPPRPILDAVPREPSVVSGDPERLTAALEHVIRNAQEAAGELGEVRVAMENRGAHTRVWIRDTGAGMDSVFIRNRLFRPFDTTKGPTGMGIGAYQAREFARRMGGKVEVQSEPGRGTNFCFEFPLVSV